MALKEIIGSEVWRGGSGYGSTPKSSPLRRSRDLLPAPWNIHHSAYVSAAFELKPGESGIDIHGTVNAGRGQSDVHLWIPAAGFADVLAAMMEADPDATWAAVRSAASKPIEDASGDRASL